MKLYEKIINGNNTANQQSKLLSSGANGIPDCWIVVDAD